MNDFLNNATEKQFQCLKKISSIEEEKIRRPHFHFASPCGWINDPNGFSFYKDKLHLFFQYHPYSNKWGPMHWGHAVSCDFLTWEFLPIALAPDSKADIDGCFSGTAIEDDGKHVIAYTGVIDENTIQNQLIAIGDGINYKKMNCNPVITYKDLPFEFDKAHFRDPKIWKENGEYYIAAVIKTNDKSGALILFKSNNLIEWKFVSVIDKSNCSFGMMWECPDYFSFNKKDVIIISPQEMKEDLQLGFHDGNNSVFMIGEMDKKNWKFNRENIYQIDYGMDFYAPETTLLPDGRRIMIGWMHNWEAISTPDEYLWSGMMTLLRELNIEDGRIFQSPIRELNNRRKNKFSGKGILDNGKITLLKNVKGRFFDFEIDLENITQQSGVFEIQFACDEKYCTVIKFDFENLEISFDRSKSGTRKDCNNFRKFKFEIPINKKIDIRLICDISSAELFLCKGKYAFTNVFYTPYTADQIKFISKKNLSFDYNFYTLV